MANEFIARKGIIVLANGIKITGSSEVNGDFTASGDIKAVNFRGSGEFLTNIAADSVQYDNVLNKPTLVSASSQIDHDATTNFVANEHIDHSTVSISAGVGLSGGGDITTTRTLTLDTSSAHFTNGVVSGLPAGTVSASSQVDHDATTNFVANEHIDHSTVSITAGNGLTGGGDITTTRTLSVDSGSMLPYYSSSIFGTVSGDITITDGGVASIAANSVALGTDTTGNYASEVTAGSGIVVSGVADEGTSFAVALDTGSATFTNGVVKALPAGTYSSSAQLPAGIISSSEQLPAGTVSASSQVIASDVTGIGNYAQLTGSNNFTEVNTFSNTTNSTDFTTGAVVIEGGLGVGKDVYISGSLNVTGLLTAVSMSTLYVTSSEYVVGTSRILLNDDDNVRFAGISVIDSGSTGGSGSLLWDSINNHWIYENTVDANYNSAILIAGPKNYGTLGNEEELIAGRIPVAIGGDHIDTNPASSSIYINFATRETHIEAGLYVTGSVTSSVGFSGDGANLSNVIAAGVEADSVALGTDTTGNYASDVTAGTGIVVGGSAGEGTSFSVALDTGSATFTNGVVKALPAATVSSSAQFTDPNAPFTGSFSGSFFGDGSGLSGIATVLAVTGSDGASVTTGTVNLKTEAITYSAGEGIDISVSSQTVTIAGEDATTTNKGIASFSTTNFNVVSGAVSSKDITINGTGVTLGGTRNITLAEITTQGATTTDQVTLGGGAIIHGTLFTSASATSIGGPVTNQVIGTVPVASYDSAHFDYVIKDSTNYRTGTVMAVWDGTSVEFTDTSTNDIGDTLEEIFTVDISGGNARLKFTSGTGTWTVKTAIRAL